MKGRTSILLISSIATVLALSGSLDQKAFAFEPTDEELQVIEIVVEYKKQLDELTYDDPEY